MFHASYRYSRRVDTRYDTQNRSTLWCAQIHVQKDNIALSSSCVLDLKDKKEDVCLSQMAMPRDWWSGPVQGPSQVISSVDVYYSVSGPFSEYSLCSTGDTDNTASPSESVPYSTSSTYVSTVTLLQSQLTFQEVQEDQHILVYIPEQHFFPGARFRVPVKLQAESDLELFVVR